MSAPTPDLDRALRSAFEALDHLGEGEPDGIGVDHLELDALGTSEALERTVEETTSEEEWERLERPDFSTPEILGRARTAKRAAAKALGVRIPEDLEWTELTVPRLAERPFRVRYDRYGETRIYVASILVEGTALAAAARFTDD